MDASTATRALRALVLVPHLLLLLGIPLYGGRLGVLAALPLLAPLPGLWRARLYTLRWSSLLLTIYAGVLAAEVWSAREPLPLALAVLAGVEFCALMLLARGMARARAASAR